MKIYNNGKLIIGIAARNEEKTIYETLHSLSIEIELFPKDIRITVIIVLNGCTDFTEKEIYRYLHSHRKNQSFKIKVKKSREGLIKAQKLIWSYKKEKDIVIYLDADVKLKTNSLYLLYKTAIKESSIKVLWASVMPIYKPTGLFSLTRILNFRDYHPEVFETRKYLCGRAFITKEYNFKFKSKTDPKTIQEKRLYKFLQLNQGPIVDDIYLTRYFNFNYGIDSVQNCSNSIVYYNPITSIFDFYISQRRTIIEMYRLNLLFPPINTSQKSTNYLEKKIFNKEFKALPLLNKIECIFYILLYSIIRNTAKLELTLKIILIQSGIMLKPINVWPSVKSSKVKFYQVSTYQ